MDSGQFCVGFSGSMNIGSCDAPVDCTLVPNGGCTVAGQACYAVGTDGTRSCYPAGTLTEGDACMPLNECQAGMECYGMGSPAVYQCRRFCRISMGMADCGGTRACMMAGGLGLPTDVGLCVLP
jgi:hypothetical protein